MTSYFNYCLWLLEGGIITCYMIRVLGILRSCLSRLRLLALVLSANSLTTIHLLIVVRCLHTSDLLCAFFERRRLCVSGFLKEADPLFKIVCNMRGCLLFGDAFRLNIDQRLP